MFSHKQHLEMINKLSQVMVGGVILDILPSRKEGALFDVKIKREGRLTLLTLEAGDLGWNFETQMFPYENSPPIYNDYNEFTQNLFLHRCNLDSFDPTRDFDLPRMVSTRLPVERAVGFTCQKCLKPILVSVTALKIAQNQHFFAKALAFFEASEAIAKYNLWNSPNENDPDWQEFIIPIIQKAFPSSQST